MVEWSAKGKWGHFLLWGERKGNQANPRKIRYRCGGQVFVKHIMCLAESEGVGMAGEVQNSPLSRPQTFFIM